MLNNPQAYKVEPNKQTRYQPVVDCTYWPMLGSFNNWNIIQFTNKKLPSGDFDAVHKLLLYGIGDYIDYIVQLGKYGSINEVDPTTMFYYVIKYLSEPYTLQEDQTIDGQVSNSTEPVVQIQILILLFSFFFVESVSVSPKIVRLILTIREKLYFKPVY